MKRYFLSIALFANLLWLNAEANPSIFREYDIRGIVNEEFCVDDCTDITSSIVTYLLQNDPSLKLVALGADGRVHSPAIKQKVKNTLLKYGLNVIDVGTCTTPVIYYSTHHLPVQAALMITASHNPGNYNGIKICQGKSLLYGDAIRQIRDLYLTKQFASPGTACGTSKDYDLISDYIGELKALFPQLVGENIHAILDCGNGAAGTVLPRLIEAMQWNSTQLLYAEVDGAYPHHIADPTVEKYMEDLKGILAASNADFGLAFDGDCDRMAPMTKAGRLVKGDQLLTILSKPLLEKAPGSAIVFDISSSTFMHDAIKKWGGQPIISRTGVAAVKNKMAETGALIGGEISCHTIFKDRYYGFDDGVYSMLRLFELLYQSKQPLEAWLNELPSSVSSPTYRIPCERQQCLKIIEMLKQTFSEEPNVEIITIDGLRIHFSHGWAIVRPSSTEPLISMRFEGRQQSDLDDIIQRFYTIISQYIEWPGIMPAHSTTSRPS